MKKKDFDTLHSNTFMNVMNKTIECGRQAIWPLTRLDPEEPDSKEFVDALFLFFSETTKSLEKLNTAYSKWSGCPTVTKLPGKYDN